MLDRLSDAHARVRALGPQLPIPQPPAPAILVPHHLAFPQPTVHTAALTTLSYMYLKSFCLLPAGRTRAIVDVGRYDTG